MAKQFLINEIKGYIENYVSNQNSDFINKLEDMKRHLCILEIQFPISCKADKGNSDNSYASIGNTYRLEDLRAVEVYINPIATTIANVYEAFEDSKKTLQSITKIIVDFIIYHELVHINQIKTGRLTHDKYQKESEEGYELNKLELEANEKASKYISSKGEFEMTIISAFRYSTNKLSKKYSDFSIQLI